MDSARSRQVVTSAWEAFASRDPERIGGTFAADAEWIAPKGNATAVALNYPDHLVGRGRIVQFVVTDFRTLFHDVTVVFRGFYADGNIVVVEERMCASLANGRPYDNEYCFVFELEGERIKRVREYMDTLKGWRMLFGPDAKLAP